MKKRADKIIASLLIFVVFAGITGFSVAKTMNKDNQDSETAKSQHVQPKTQAKKQAEPSKQKKQKKKIEKPKAVAKKSAATGPSAPAQNLNLSIQAPSNAKLKDGVYYGSGTGFGGRLSVKVVVSGNKIADIQVTSHSETLSPINYFANGASVISRILSAQTPNVDKVTGATYTSNAIKTAVYNAIKDAYETEAPPIVAPVVPEEKDPSEDVKPGDDKDKNKDEDKDKNKGNKDEEKDNRTEEEIAENKQNIFRGDVIFHGKDYDYDVVVKVEIKDGKVVKLTDHKTREELDKSKFAGANLTFWNIFLDANGFDRFEGKTEAEIKDVDAVTNATATTDGVKQAIIKAFENAKREAKSKDKDVNKDTNKDKTESNPGK